VKPSFEKHKSFACQHRAGRECGAVARVARPQPRAIRHFASPRATIRSALFGKVPMTTTSTRGSLDAPDTR